MGDPIGAPPVPEEIVGANLGSATFSNEGAVLERHTWNFRRVARARRADFVPDLAAAAICRRPGDRKPRTHAHTVPHEGKNARASHAHVLWDTPCRSIVTLETARMKKQCSLNVLQPEEEYPHRPFGDGVLEELLRRTHESRNYFGNISRTLSTLSPASRPPSSMSASAERAFCHVSDVEPAYYRHIGRYGEERWRPRSARDSHRGPGPVFDRPRRPKDDDFDDLMSPEIRVKRSRGVILEAPRLLDEPFEKAKSRGRCRRSTLWRVPGPKTLGSCAR